MKLKTAFDSMYWVAELLCKVLLVAQVVIVGIVVFGRYVLSSTPAWGEELSLLCMVWFCLVSAPLAIRDRTHLKLTIIDFFVSPLALRIIMMFVYIMMISFGIFMLLEGTNLVLTVKNNMMSGVRISVGFLYGAVPVSGFFLIILSIEQLWSYVWPQRR